MLSGSERAEVNYMGNQGRLQFSSNPFTNSYNQGRRQNFGGKQYVDH